MGTGVGALVGDRSLNKISPSQVISKRVPGKWEGVGNSESVLDVLQIHNLGQWLAAWTFSSNFFGEGSLSTLILKVHFLLLDFFFGENINFAMF